MPLLHLIILAVLQGITEFLPISSSGHLVLLPIFLDWRDQGLLIDVSVHVGTLFAVMIYFRRDLGQMIRGGFSTFGIVKKRPGDRDGKLFRFTLLASLPVFIAGGALALSGHEDIFRNPLIIGITSIGFGLVLYGADKWGLMVRKVDDLTTRSALFIGLSQALALIPGTSRSGITMTAARFLGFERTEAARFSMLLSIPVILAAGSWSTWELIKSGIDAEIWSAAIAALLSFLTALLAIYFLMRWLEKASMTIFVVYRVVLGGVILIYLL